MPNSGTITSPLVEGNNRRSDAELAAALIENQHKPEQWLAAFRSLKFDTDDNPEYEGERWVVILAKGDRAAQVAEAYDRG